MHQVCSHSRGQAFCPVSWGMSRIVPDLATRWWRHICWRPPTETQAARRSWWQLCLLFGLPAGCSQVQEHTPVSLTSVWTPRANNVVWRTQLGARSVCSSHSLSLCSWLPTWCWQLGRAAPNRLPGFHHIPVKPYDVKAINEFHCYKRYGVGTVPNLKLNWHQGTT